MCILLPLGHHLIVLLCLEATMPSTIKQNNHQITKGKSQKFSPLSSCITLGHWFLNQSSCLAPVSHMLTPISQPASQTHSQSVSQLASCSVNQSVSKPVSELVSQLVSQPASHLVSRSVLPSFSQSASPPAIQLVSQSGRELASLPFYRSTSCKLGSGSVSQSI